jgi:hypothetical protein
MRAAARRGHAGSWNRQPRPSLRAITRASLLQRLRTSAFSSGWVARWLRDKTGVMAMQSDQPHGLALHGAPALRRACQRPNKNHQPPPSNPGETLPAAPAKRNAGDPRLTRGYLSLSTIMA